MMKRIQNLLQDRKTLCLVLCVAVVSVFTLSIAYAAMSAVLEIHGNSEVTGSNWSFTITKTPDEQMKNIAGDNDRVDENFILFGDSSLVSSGTIHRNGVSGVDVSISKPGDGVVGIYRITNTGTIPAKISSATLRNINYTSLTSNSSDIDWAKNYMRYEFEIGADGLESLEEYIFCPGSYMDVGLFLIIDEDATTIPSGAIELSNIGVDLSFVQTDISACK